MQEDFKRLIQELSNWRKFFETIKKKHFNFMTRPELDIFSRIEIKHLPKVFKELEKIVLKGE